MGRRVGRGGGRRSPIRSSCSSSRATRRSRTPTCARSPSRPSACSCSRCSSVLHARLADLLLPGTSYLEREGTYVNLEGRLQRLRRAVLPPAPDELAWIARLGERFGVDISPYAASCSRSCRRWSTTASRSARSAGRRRCRPVGAAARRRRAAQRASRDARTGLRLVTYRPLFSGPAVERVPSSSSSGRSPSLEIS